MFNTIRTSGIIYHTSSSLIPRIVIARPPVIVSLLTSPVALKPLSLYMYIEDEQNTLCQHYWWLCYVAIIHLSYGWLCVSCVLFSFKHYMSVRPPVYVPWPVWLLYCFFVVRGMIKNLLQMLHERIYYVSGDLQSMLHLALEYFLKFSS